MKFFNFQNFLNEEYRSTKIDPQIDKKNLAEAKKIVESMGYKIVEDSILANQYTQRIEFTGINGTFNFECTDEGMCYFGYFNSVAAITRHEFYILSIKLEYLKVILLEIQYSCAPLHAINSFFSILGFDTKHFFVHSLRKKSSIVSPIVTSSVEYKKMINDVLNSIRMYCVFGGQYQLIFAGRMKWVSKSDPSIRGEKTSLTFEDFEHDDFFLEIMEKLNISNIVAKNIIEEFKHEPLGTCIPQLSHKFRGLISTKSFGI